MSTEAILVAFLLAGALLATVYGALLIGELVQPWRSCRTKRPLAGPAPPSYGWFVDPFGRHEARYFSEDGTPTKLVRDGHAESYDSPPSTAVPVGVLREAVPPVDSADRPPSTASPGEKFEDRWGGSEGYTRPEGPPPANWTSRLIVPIFTPLRPSRFRDPSYWRSYLPGVGIVFVLLFLVLPILLGVVLGPATHPTQPFAPTAAQRDALHQGGLLVNPNGCAGTDLPTTTAYTIGPSDDGKAFTLSRGDQVALVTSYGQPVFSGSSPLCSSRSSLGSDGEIDVVATGLGTAFIYFPRQDGSVSVVRVNITPPRSYVPFALWGTLGIVLVDTGLAVWVGRSRRHPPSR